MGKWVIKHFFWVYKGEREQKIEKKQQDMGKQVDKEDERKEAAIASTPALQPNFKPKGVTQNQLSKFQVTTHIYTQIILLVMNLYVENWRPNW